MSRTAGLTDGEAAYADWAEARMVFGDRWMPGELSGFLAGYSAACESAAATVESVGCHCEAMGSEGDPEFEEDEHYGILSHRPGRRHSQVPVMRRFNWPVLLGCLLVLAAFALACAGSLSLAWMALRGR